MKIRLAELNIEVHPRYTHVERLCAGYFAEFETPDLTVEVSEDEIEAERAASPVPPSAGYAESICIYRRIAMELPRFGAFVFHAAVVECDGRGYAFAAQSGTGKSTHVTLWLRHFGNRARIINGDKPILRFMDGAWRAYGTPWCGKEHWECNTSVPLAGLCFLERAKENAIRPLDGMEMLQRLFMQVLPLSDREAAVAFLDLLSDMIDKTPCYLLSCNMEETAAAVAYSGMTGKKKENTNGQK